MTTLTAPESRAAGNLEIIRKGSIIFFNNVKNYTSIMFIEGEPVGVLQGAVVYQREGTKGSVTRAINAWAGEQCVVARAAVENFDFIVGQVLMQAGIPLTKRV